MYSQLISYSMTVVILVVHTKVGVLLLYLVFEAVVGLYMERCTLMLGNSWRSPSAWKKEERPWRTERSSRASMRPTDSMCITVAARRSRSSRSRVVAAPFCTACRDPPPLPLLAFGVGKKNPRLVVLGGYLPTYTHTYSLAYIVL